VRTGYLPALTYLSLASNSLIGSIPESFKCLTGLTTLVLSDNNLSGGMPELFDGTQLQYVVWHARALTKPCRDKGSIMIAHCVHDDRTFRSTF
jgi:hypothetical protein